MVKLKDLKAPKERYIREVITTPNGAIRVFEPHLDDIETVLNIQNEDGEKGKDFVEFPDDVVIRQLFPLLTDLDMSDISDEELRDIVENPSIYLLQVQNIVSQIVTEINSMFMQRLKSELLQANAIVDQASLVQAIPQIVSKEARRLGNDKEADKFSKLSKSVNKEVEEEAEEEVE